MAQIFQIGNRIVRIAVDEGDMRKVGAKGLVTHANTAGIIVCWEDGRSLDYLESVMPLDERFAIIESAQPANEWLDRYEII